ncbi:MAG TPA: hypothetical protein VFO79_11410, partial [Xanthomonadales bacterium]|nr:hypothetical protein [Xanthomonadales bacterium]
AYGGYGGLAFNSSTLTVPATPNGSVSAPQESTLGPAGYGQITVAAPKGFTFTITSIVVNGPFVRTGGTCPDSGGVNGTCTVGVSFAPAAGGTGGTSNGSVVVNSNIGSGTLLLVGQGQAVSNVPALNPLGLIALGLGLFGLAWARSRG